jgi:dynein heavy chain
MISLGTVCMQEVDRYNGLLEKLESSLTRLQQALKGEVAMDRELEEVLGALRYQLVPRSWEKAAYPSRKPLASWFIDLINRVEFFRDWNDTGLPMTYWLGGFFFPQGFLTGVLQTHSRQFSLPIDSLRFKAHVMKDSDPDEAHLDFVSTGVYIHGLWLEGARWDVDRQCISESAPRQLFARMPIIWLEPVNTPDEDQVSYNCPLYKISTRAGALSTTGTSTNFVLALKLAPGESSANHWTKRGTALLTTLDD